MRNPRVDANQAQIVQALRDAGATVYPTHGVHGGFPDLAVGFRGKTFLLEIKDGSKPPSGQSLTDQQIVFFRDWRGHAVVVNSPEAALAAVGLVPLVGVIS